MKMFVANGTHQNIDFQYRLKEFKTYRMQNIPIGGQIRISGELTEQQIDIIVLSHAKYGMVRYNEISDFRGFFIPYIFSIDTPVHAEVIAELVIQNREYSKFMGERQRAEAAIAVNAQIEDNSGEKLTSFQMEIIEKQTKDRDPTIEEKITITRSKERGAPQGPDEKGPLGIVTDFLRPKTKAGSMF